MGHRTQPLPDNLCAAPGCLAVVPGTMQDERAYHAKFHHLRERGEWFRAERALVDFATALHDGQ